MRVVRGSVAELGGRVPRAPSSWQGLALPSTSFVGRDCAVAGKLVDPKAKPWDDGELLATDVYKYFRIASATSSGVACGPK